MSKSYKTAEACKVLDVQPYVLRYWETEFPALGGKKSGPQRVYSEPELQVLKRIKELLYDEGYTMGGAKKRLSSELEDAEGNGASAAEPLSEETENGTATSSKAVRKKSAKPARAKGKTKATAKEAKNGEQESLDTGDRVQIETVQLELRKLHAEAAQILSLVRAAK